MDARNSKRNRRIQFSLRATLLMTPTLGIIIWLLGAAIREPSPAYYTWDEIRQRYPAWTVVRGPDGAGLFQRLGDVCAGKGSPVSGSFRGKGVTTDFQMPADPSGELRVVGLMAKDGSRPTYAVLLLKDR